MKRRRAIVWLLAFFVLPVEKLPAGEAPPATTQTTLATQPLSYDRHADIIYGRSYGTALTMDVLTPKGPRNGAGVILVVSGGWFSASEPLALPAMQGFYTPFTERGFVVFAVVHGSQPKFTIPEIRLDINRAVRFIRTHASDWQIDPDRLGITGGSAGGHLSCLQGCDPLPPDEKSPDPVQHASSKVQAVACLFPPTDFLNWGEKNMNALDTANMAPYLAAFDFHEPDAKTHLFMRITDRPRVAAIEKEISPITHASKDSPPTLIIHGDADTLVPIQQSQELIDKLRDAKVPAELVVKKGAGHGWADTKGDMQKMAEWFEKYLLNKKD